MLNIFKVFLINEKECMCSGILWSLGWNACTACAVLHVRETPSPDSRRSVSLAPSHTADLKSKKKIGLFFQSIPRNWNTSSRSCVECEHGTGSHLRSCHRFTDGAQSHYSRWIFQKTWDLLMGNWSRICIFLKPWKHWKPWKRFKDCLEMIQKKNCRNDRKYCGISIDQLYNITLWCPNTDSLKIILELFSKSVQWDINIYQIWSLTCIKVTSFTFQFHIKPGETLPTELNVDHCQLPHLPILDHIRGEHS